MTEQPQASGDDEPVQSSSSSSAPQTRHRVRSADPPLPDQSSDEDDHGWGDEPAGRDDDWYLRERPPHH